MKKVIIGGVLAGIVLFLWGAVSHMALPLGEIGIRSLPLGLLTALEVEVSYWNWYGFPTNYLLAQLVDHIIGWSLAGLVLARFCRS